jgi:hypothetical protein
MDGGKIGDAPWGCILVFSIIGFLAAICLLVYAFVWLFNHVHIS